MGSKYVDSSSCIQLIGCVMKQPSLLNDEGKYFFTEHDFINDFHKVVFGSVYNLYTMGAQNVSLKAIEDYLANRPESLGIYRAGKGAEWISKAIESADLANFDYYYSRVKKMTLLREYDKCGVDVSWIYDPDNILDIQKRQKQENYLDSLSLQQIADIITERIENICRTYVDNSTDEASCVGNNIYQLLEELEKAPEVGPPMYGSLINTVTRGMREKKFYMRSAPTGVGKAIPNDTLIPTPIGWRRVGDIKPGDKLFGQDGKETTVLQIYPQPQRKEVWKVTFADGRDAECCGEHLWEYRYKSHEGYSYRVEDIETIYKRTLTLKNGLKDSDGKGYRFHVKLNKPIEYEEKQFYLPPYVMGALLGDGSFRYNNSNKSLMFSSTDEQIPNLIANALGYKEQEGKTHVVYAKKSSKNNYSWTFRDKEDPNHPFWVEEMLKDYPELWNLKSEYKFIPKDYLQGSIAQRQCLLQGLMDTDGSVDKKGRTSFTTVSPQLRDDFIELCRSLGFVAVCSTDLRDQYTTGKCYVIHIQASKEMKKYFFKLPRKRSIIENYLTNNKREEHKDHLAIINIEKTTKLSDMTCFTVDNDDHLFLMNDFIVTHNTRTMIADACYNACAEIYNSQTRQWEPIPSISLPTLYISTELELSEVQTMCLAFLSDVNEEHILTNSYGVGEKDRVLYAAQVLSQAPLYIEVVPDFSLKDIENIIKRNIRTRKCKYVFN